MLAALQDSLGSSPACQVKSKRTICGLFFFFFFQMPLNLLFTLQNGSLNLVL